MGEMGSAYGGCAVEIGQDGAGVSSDLGSLVCDPCKSVQKTQSNSLGARQLSSAHL